MSGELCAVTGHIMLLGLSAVNLDITHMVISVLKCLYSLIDALFNS